MFCSCLEAPESLLLKSNWHFVPGTKLLQLQSDKLCSEPTRWFVNLNDANRSFPVSDETKKSWNYFTIPTFVFKQQWSIKHRCDRICRV